MYKIIRAQQEMKVYPQHVDVTRAWRSRRGHNSRLIDFALTPQNSRCSLLANSLALRGFGAVLRLADTLLFSVYLLSGSNESTRWNILPQLCKYC
jgi:hypothetical protein